MTTNSTAQENQFNVLREQIETSLEKAQEQKNKLKRNNSRFTIANTILSGFATLLAGAAGTVGNAANWKPICLLAAVCSAGATVTANMQTSEKLTEASDCLVQLQALKLETINPTYNLEQVREKYQQIIPDLNEQ